MGGQRHAPGALCPQKTRYPLCWKLDGPQGPSGRVRKISFPPGFDLRTVQPVASRYTDCAIPAHKVMLLLLLLLLLPPPLLLLLLSPLPLSLLLLLLLLGNRRSVVGIQTILLSGTIRGSKPGKAKRFFSPKLPDYLCGPPSLLFNERLGYFPGRIQQLGQEDKSPQVRMRGAIFSSFMAWPRKTLLFRCGYGSWHG